MAAYAYTAINADGLELTGEVHAPTVEAAREQLRVKGLVAEDFRELPASAVGRARAAAAGMQGDGLPATTTEGVSSFMKSVKAKSLQVFSRQFATMIDAGLNVVTALNILEEQTDDTYLSEVIGEVRVGRRGRSSALPGARPPSEGVLPPLRLDGRGRRGGRDPRRGARSPGHPDREGGEHQAAREGGDDLSHARDLVRVPRPDRDAPLHRPHLREAVQATRRPAADADAMDHRRLRPAALALVRHVPRDRARCLRLLPLEANRGRVGSGGTPSSCVSR